MSLSIDRALRSWHSLQEALRDCTETYAALLFKVEQEGRHRPFMLRRIHQRINKLRAKREREELWPSSSPSASTLKRSR
jgi:hypothetical protein